MPASSSPEPPAAGTGAVALTSPLPGRRALVAALVLATAAPAAAQEFVWSPDRPDAVAPTGVFADRTLPAGSYEISALYARTSHDGIRFGSELVDPLSLFETFEIVPFAMSTDGWFVRGAVGATEDLTLAARAGFLMRTREQITEDLTYFVLESSGITDIELQALYGFWDRDAIRAHLHAGLSIPTGTVEASGGFGDIRSSGTLPYDMQTGAGAWGFSPGLTAQIMNEAGSVGAQVFGTLYFLEKRDWRAGNRVEANAWAAYRLNRFFSASARLHAIGFEAIEGFDPELEPSRDPGEWPISFAGTRVSLPVGMNFYMPEGRWTGHRLAVEIVFPVYERFDGPWLSTERTVKVGWQLGF